VPSLDQDSLTSESAEISTGLHHSLHILDLPVVAKESRCLWDVRGEEGPERDELSLKSVDGVGGEEGVTGGRDRDGINNERGKGGGGLERGERASDGGDYGCRGEHARLHSLRSDVGGHANDLSRKSLQGISTPCRAASSKRGKRQGSHLIGDELSRDLMDGRHSLSVLDCESSDDGHSVAGERSERLEICLDTSSARRVRSSLRQRFSSAKNEQREAETGTIR
jgi:hypothetical protein